MLYLRAGVMALALSMLGAASFQDKKPDDKKPDNPAPAVKVKGTLPTFYKKLGLRDDQMQQVYKIRSDSRTKQEELRRKIDKLRADEKEALEKVLTPEQLKHCASFGSARSPTTSNRAPASESGPPPFEAARRWRRGVSPPVEPPPAGSRRAATLPLLSLKSRPRFSTRPGGPGENLRC